MTRADGMIAGTDTNIVDGLPVYNACVVIKGSYAAALTRNITRASTRRCWSKGTSTSSTPKNCRRRVTHPSASSCSRTHSQWSNS